MLDLLDRQGIACRCRQMDGTFFTHRVVRDMADFFTFAVNPADGACFLRMYYKLRAGITKGAAQWAVQTVVAGESLLDVLSQCPGLSQWSRGQCRALSVHFARLREERGDWAEDRLRHAMGYGEYLKERGGDLGKLDILEALGRHVPNLGALLDRLEELRTLVRQERQGPAQGLILSTIHASKGLEYQRVILMDVADGLLPLVEAPVGRNPDPAAVEAYEEERRLFYVGMTRAKETLAVFRFQKASCPGQRLFGRPSFPKSKSQPVGPVRTRRRTVGREGAPDGTGYFPGVSVTHRTFGRGKWSAGRGTLPPSCLRGDRRSASPSPWRSGGGSCGGAGRKPDNLRTFPRKSRACFNRIECFPWRVAAEPPSEMFLLQGQPAEEPVLIEQAAVRGPAPGQRDRAGIGAEQISHPLPGGNVGVPGQKDLGGPDGGRIVGAIPMAMGQKDGQALPGNGGGTGVHGKRRPQGARAAVTVSLYPQNLPGQGAEQLDDLMGVVFILGSIGPGIDQVPQQDKLLGAFLLIAFQQLPAEPGGNYGRTR